MYVVLNTGDINIEKIPILLLNDLSLDVRVIINNPTSFPKQMINYNSQLNKYKSKIVQYAHIIQ